MTDAVLIAIVTGAVTTIGSLITAVVSIRNGQKADRLEAKSDEIHKVTNSHLSKVTDALAAANKEIADLKGSVHTFLDRNKPKPKP